MEYNDQFIRLSCSLMQDYRMMKLNADMKCVGLGLYISMMLFLRRQEGYRHDLGKLDLLAKNWGATVEEIQHLINDFDLYEISEDGYFSCKYLDEAMGYQREISRLRADAGRKGGKSGKKTTVKPSEGTSEKVVPPASGNDGNGMKNGVEQNDEVDDVKNEIQPTDNECNSVCSQASDKQNFKREEKKREEKNKKKDLDITKRKIEEFIWDFNLKWPDRFVDTHFDDGKRTVHWPLKIYILHPQDYISYGCKIINLSPPSP